MAPVERTTVRDGSVNSNSNAGLAGENLTARGQLGGTSGSQNAILLQSSIKLRKLGVTGILLCCGVVACDFASSFIFELGILGLIGGLFLTLLFGLLSGFLAIKAARMKPHVSAKLVRASYGIGVTCLIIHPLSLLISIHNVCQSDAYYTRYGRSTLSDYVAFARTNSWIRLFLCIMVLLVDISQLKVLGQVIDFFFQIGALALAAPANSATTTIPGEAAPTETVTAPLLPSNSASQPAEMTILALPEDATGEPPSYEVVIRQLALRST